MDRRNEVTTIHPLFIWVMLEVSKPVDIIHFFKSIIKNKNLNFIGGL
jgi:hypothetical protein